MAKNQVAVIGSGLAGLSSAFLLATVDGHPFTVHLYEKSHGLGMDSGSLQVPCPCVSCDNTEPNTPHLNERVDVPMRSFFPEYYPYLRSLYDYIKIPYDQINNSMSFSTNSIIQDQTEKIFKPSNSFPLNVDLDNIDKNSKSKGVFSVALPYISFSCYTLPFFNVMFSFPDFPAFFLQLFFSFAVIFDYVKLLVISKVALYLGWLKFGHKTGPLRDLTIGEFFQIGLFSNSFVKGCFYPLFSGVCTCSFECLSQYPATLVLEYVATCMPFGKASFVTTSVNHVVTELSSPIDKVFTNSGVDKIETLDPKLNGGNKFRVFSSSNTEGIDYTHIIFATQANQASRLVKITKSTRSIEKTVEILDSFEYKKALVICHTDESILPKRSRWRVLNFTFLEKTSKFANSLPSFFKNEYPKHEITNTNTTTPTPTTKQTATIKTAAHDYPITDISQCTHIVSIHKSKKTINEPLFQSSSPSNFETPSEKRRMIFQTTNPILTPDIAKTLAVSWFERCVVTLHSQKQLRVVWGLENKSDEDCALFFGEGDKEWTRGGVQGVDGRWFVGSYIWPGIPLLEGCVASSVMVVRAICKEEGVRFELPWVKNDDKKNQ